MITEDDGNQNTTTGKGTFVMASTGHMWQPTSAICVKDGVILQLWDDRLGGGREWRTLFTFEEATKMYGGKLAP